MLLLNKSATISYYFLEDDDDFDVDGFDDDSCKISLSTSQRAISFSFTAF